MSHSFVELEHFHSTTKTPGRGSMVVKNTEPLPYSGKLRLCSVEYLPKRKKVTLRVKGASSYFLVIRGNSRGGFTTYLPVS